MAKLTREQAQKVEAEANSLMGLARQQHAEWKAALSQAATIIRGADGSTPEDTITNVLVWIDNIKLQFMTTRSQELVVSYDFPDELVDFIEIPTLTWSSRSCCSSAWRAASRCSLSLPRCRSEVHHGVVGVVSSRAAGVVPAHGAAAQRRAGEWGAGTGRVQDGPEHRCRRVLCGVTPADAPASLDGLAAHVWSAALMFRREILIRERIQLTYFEVAMLLGLGAVVGGLLVYAMLPT